MDLYLAKRKLMKPYVAVMRRLMRNVDPSMQKALAVHDYGPSFLGFALRFVLDPAILYRASVDDVRVVLDVGAFDGQWAKQVAERYPDAVIHSFEPDPGVLRATRRNLADVPNVELSEFGLSDCDARVRLIQQGPGSTAAIDAAVRLDPTVQGRRGVDVQMRDVKAVLDELGLHRVDLLKVNIEGGEYRLLERLLDAGYLGRCRSVIIQFHEWYPNAYALRRRIHRRMRRTHRLAWSSFFVWEQWTRKGERPARSSQSSPKPWL